ncbi:hypothetical protein [Ochrobactrum sp. BTU2]|uniref:hypothetical protein n=1 Tax=Ochrobactrum sp. BTU2 TaxID=2856166 RepID=UPI0013130207|nr:hypothetical protein [Ochrobactrum sp. BTU2]KAB2761721.1 hypothetical protein F9K98_15495 [Brucella anthropi]MCQ9145131.1 hypothetical protein [Ochrobactrum sp. BTU2]
MKLSSDFAALDVKIGRKALTKHFQKRPRLGPCPEKLRIPIVIHGYLDDQLSHDDGVSTEFSVIVEKVEVQP